MFSEGIREELANIFESLQNLPQLFFQSKYLNPFLVNVPILYPLKTQENLWLSLVYSGGLQWWHCLEMGYEGLI